MQAVDWHEGLASARAELTEEIARLERFGPATQALDIPRIRKLSENLPTGGWQRLHIIERYVLPCYVAFPPDISYAKLRVATLSRIDLKEGASVTPVVTSFKLLVAFPGLSWRDRALLFEAAAELESSSLVALVPFKFTTRLAQIP